MIPINLKKKPFIYINTFRKDANHTLNSRDFGEESPQLTMESAEGTSLSPSREAGISGTKQSPGKYHSTCRKSEEGWIFFER